VVELKNEFRKTLIESLNIYARDTESADQAKRARTHIKAIETRQWTSPMILPNQSVKTKVQQQYNAAIADARRQLHSGLLEMINDNPDAGPCTNLLVNLEDSEDVELMARCMDFYWHHQLLDWPPMSYSNVIELSRRYVQLESDDVEVYVDAAWLLWSRWVTWKIHPARMPIGEAGDKAAQQLLLEGREKNMANGQYHYEAAKAMWPVAKYHDSTYYSFVIDSLKLAEKYPESDKAHAATCKLLGHTYRAMKDLKAAANWYEKGLESAPDDEVLTRMLREVTSGEANQSAEQN